MKVETTRRSHWRQPLLHFFVAGMAIFLLNALRGEDSAAASGNNITVTIAQVERMAQLWSRTWGRPPAEGELQGLVRDHIIEEIYYREALKLGLDVNDTVIRRRLRQKMEFLSEGDSSLTEPDEETLNSYFAANAERYRNSETFDFRQIYLSDSTQERVNAVLSALNSGEAPGRFGESIGLPDEMNDANEAAIARVFGALFATNIKDLPAGGWAGPVQSSFGAHVVQITSKKPARPAAFSEIRSRVMTDWRADETTQRRSEAFEALRAQYDVEIEQPE